MEILNDISTLLQQGRAPKVKEKVQEALDQGISAKDIPIHDKSMTLEGNYNGKEKYYYKSE